MAIFAHSHISWLFWQFLGMRPIVEINFWFIVGSGVKFGIILLSLSPSWHPPRYFFDFLPTLLNKKEEKKINGRQVYCWVFCMVFLHLNAVGYFDMPTPYHVITCHFDMRCHIMFKNGGGVLQQLSFGTTTKCHWIWFDAIGCQFSLL